MEYRTEVRQENEIPPYKNDNKRQKNKRQESQKEKTRQKTV